MCGIAGFQELRAGVGSLPIEEIGRRMCDAIASRGPDGSGLWSDPTAGLCFGHRRLAIVDLTPTGAQPMHSRSGRFVITYNGEIYNAPALRDELTARGVRFIGTSDTEVMLAGFEFWGVAAALSRFAGMFALALWDRHERRLVLARDRMGEKPLYYGWVGQRFAFASDLAALRQLPGWSGAIATAAVDQLLRANYIPAPLSIYAGIRKLPPASFLTMDERSLAGRGLGSPEAYWSLAEVALRGEADPFGGSDVEAVDSLHRLLREVIAEQRVADVPVGALLSGGIDSSTVVALMQEVAAPVRTFTMASDDPAYDESAAAAAVSRHLGTAHTELPVTDREALALIPSLPDIYTEPFADSSQIPTTLVCRRARQSVTVCLTGDGGDEVFCGYNRHVRLDQLWSLASRVPEPVRRALGRGIAAVPPAAYASLLRMAGPGVLGDRLQKLGLAMASDSMESAYRLLATQWPAPTPALGVRRDATWIMDDPARWPQLRSALGRLLWAENMTSLPDDMLVKVDRAAMSCGLETRAPLLDHRVVEFAWRLPWHMRVRDDRGKWILRALLGRYLPASMIDRRKQGFSIPMDRWLSGPLREWAEALLTPEALSDGGLLDVAPIRAAWREHLEGRRRWQGRLWGVLMLQAWRASVSSAPRS